MELTDNITLELVKEDFVNTKYSDCSKCAIERAVYRVFGLDATESVDFLRVNDYCYEHKPYKLRHFIADKTKAYKANDGEVIRVIELTKI